MLNTLRNITSLVIISSFGLACSQLSNNLRTGNSIAGQNGDSSASSDGSDDSEAGIDFKQCEIGKDHFGFGDRKLESRIKGNLAQTDLDNVQGIRGIEASYDRLGLSQDCLASARGAFARQQDRWLAKEQASVLTVSAVHNANFCAAQQWLQSEGVPADVNSTDAGALCTKMIEAACMAPAEDYQVAACSELIETHTADESIVSRRYAHGIAAVLSSACVLTY